MAVTKIWPVKSNMSHVIDYANNPEKTELSLEDALQYAVNGEKTEQGCFVSGINCEPSIADKQFQLVKKQFNKEGGIVAYHAYQSFAEGEVTPQQAHDIGVRLAEQLWGDTYQVVVATHLNTDCCHNHFVVNSVSFMTGKRCREKQWSHIATISDEICKEIKLSVIENRNGYHVPKGIYIAEHEGKPTRLTIAKSVMDDALQRSLTLRELEMNLKREGYYCNFDPGRKYWTIRQKDWQRPIRIIRMGENYTNEALMDRIKANLEKGDICYIPERRKKRSQYNLPKRIHRIRKKGGLQGLYLHYCYVLGVLPKYTQSQKRVHYLYRDDLLKLKSISDEAKFLTANNIDTAEHLAEKKQELEDKVAKLTEQRTQLRNEIRHVDIPVHEANKLKVKISNLSSELKQIKREIHLCEGVQDRSDKIQEKMKMAEREMKVQRQR